ncbi:MAG TPA: diguanylate cyclase [Thermoleophilaceae bacterium]
MARMVALLALAGALLWLLAAALPHAPGVDTRLLFALALAATATALLAVVLFDRIPVWGFHVLGVWGSALTSVSVYAWGPESGFAPLPYAWIVIGAFYFFPLTQALLHWVVVGVGYALALVAEAPDWTPAAEWVATVGALLAIGLLVALVRDRIGNLAAPSSVAAQRDLLTGLLDRRGFETTFDVELERARRTSTPLSLVVLDVDRFAHVNENRGRGAGDATLRRIADTLEAAKRSFDSAARVGGDEFAVLVPDSDENGAYMLAERVRGELERGDGPAVSASFGIATFPQHGQSIAALLEAADQALFTAQRMGRNRAVISSAEVPGVLGVAPRGRAGSPVELSALLSLAEALDVRDSGSSTHSRRVGRFAELIARELGLPPEGVERVRLAGILHDVGRVGVPDALLRKRGPLTDEEWRSVRSHPEIGARMLATTSFGDIGDWILRHHVRPDGRGYPEGEPWEAVPLEARILAVADAYEALTADRAHRPAWPPDQAASELRREAGRQFDREVVDALLRVV